MDSKEKKWDFAELKSTINGLIVKLGKVDRALHLPYHRRKPRKHR